MSADCFSDADYICYTDSDTIYSGEFDLKEEFIDNSNKINLFVDTWNNVGDANCWKICLINLGLLTEYEFMRRLPIIMPSFVLKEIRKAIEIKTNKDFITGCLDLFKKGGISEFNIMSSYFYIKYNNKCNIIHINQANKLPIIQLWSHNDKTKLLNIIHDCLGICD
jgi:hypothetical protein